GQPEDDVALWLGKLDARLCLNQHQEFRAELAALAARKDLGKHAGTVRLLQGYERLTRDGQQTDDPPQPVPGALQMRLPPEETAYAEALLAPTAPEVIEHLQDALEADPFHRRALDRLPALLIFTGHLPEAREAVARLRNLAPNSSSALTDPVLLYALDGDL